MAANGHAGLPPQITHQAPPQAAAPQAPASGHTAGDSHVAQAQAAALTAAIQQVKDPQLASVFSAALSALHRYLAQDQKETHAAMQGKFSPRQMAKAVGK